MSCLSDSLACSISVTEVVFQIEQSKQQSKMTSTTKMFDEKELKEVARHPIRMVISSKSFYIQAFRLFDSNNDGRITTEEFVKLIKKIGGIMTGGQAKALLTLVSII